jgi:hypothetical protein
MHSILLLTNRPGAPVTATDTLNIAAAAAAADFVLTTTGADHWRHQPGSGAGPGAAAPWTLRGEARQADSIPIICFRLGAYDV